MDSEANRLDSFFNQSYQWPHSSSTHPNCTPELLAAAGFYYAPTEGYLDLCKCHYCGLRLRDW